MEWRNSEGKGVKIWKAGVRIWIEERWGRQVEEIERRGGRAGSGWFDASGGMDDSKAQAL